MYQAQPMSIAHWELVRYKFDLVNLLTILLLSRKSMMNMPPKIRARINILPVLNQIYNEPNPIAQFTLAVLDTLVT